MAAAAGDAAALAEALASEGAAALRAVNGDGGTALHLAARAGSEPCVALLLSHGASKAAVREQPARAVGGAGRAGGGLG